MSTSVGSELYRKFIEDREQPRYWKVSVEIQDIQRPYKSNRTTYVIKHKARAQMTAVHNKIKKILLSHQFDDRDK